MAFQQNAALPGIDLSALNGMNISAEQLMTIAQLLQSGQLTLPPPAPNASPTSTALPVSAPVPTSALPPAAASLALEGHDVDMDKEEGELEDDDVSSHAHGLASEARRSSLTDRTIEAQSGKVNGAQMPAPFTIQSQNGAKPSPGVVSRTLSVPETGDGLPSIAVKAFVLELHRVGYGFEDLAREVGNTPALRKLYKQIGLPFPPTSSAPATTTQKSVAQRAPANGASKMPTTTVDAQRQTAAKPTVAAKTAPAANGKPDRASYLAKLQAAKNKKAEPMVESPTGKPTQSPAVPVAVATQFSSPAVSIPTSQSAGKQSGMPQPVLAAVSQPVSATSTDSPRVAATTRPGKVTVDTELVRQRLAKLQAERAAAHTAQRLSSDASIPDGNNQPARTHSNNSAQAGPIVAVPLVPSTSTPTASSAAVSYPAINTHALPPHVPAAASPSIARGSGLPGLFTTRTPVPQSSSPMQPPNEVYASAQVSAQPQAAAALATQTQSPANSPAPLNIPPQRLANGQQPSWNSPHTLKRPFGESGMQDEAFIIETSSDEDDGEDMDTDESPEPETKPLPARSVGVLPNFPPKFDLQQGTSTPGTPGLDLKRKLEEIQIAKQKLEELKRRKVSVKPGSSVQSPGATLTARSSVSLSDAATPSADPVNQSSIAVAYPNKQQEKDALRKRLQELKDSLGQKQTGGSPAAFQTPESSTQLAAQRPAEQPNGAADAEDDDDDGDLYESGNVTTTHEEETSAQTPAPAITLETQESEDEDVQFYEPQDFVATGDMETLQLKSDSSKIGSQATTHSAITNADAADTQLTAEMDAAMALDVDLGPTLSSQPGSEIIKAGQDVEQGGVGIEDGEIADDDSSEDMYEPSLHEASQPVAATGASQEAETHVLQEDEHNDGNESMDISDESESDASDVSSDDYEPEPNKDPQKIVPEAFDLPESSEASKGEELQEEAVNQAKHLAIDDDLAPELQPTAEQHVAVAATALASAPGFYKPYTSELTRFKEYRYHPSFIDSVPGGHKSLTYSNNIDVEKPVCPFEIGGRCNDKDCQFQHFRTSECC